MEHAFTLAAFSAGAGLPHIVYLIGVIWLAVMAFQSGDKWWWGLVIILTGGLGGLIYGFLFWPATKIPLILLIIGILLTGIVTTGFVSL